MFHHIVNYHVDCYLLKFLFIIDIANLRSANRILRSANRHLNKSITKTKIGQQMTQPIGISKNKIMEKCYEQGLLKILKNTSIIIK